MAFTDISTPGRQQATKFTSALDELRFGTIERRIAIGLGSITYSTPVRIQEYSTQVQNIRTGLEALIVSQTDGQFGVWNSPTFTPYADFDEVLTAAGHPGGWLSFGKQENLRLWILQLQDVAEELINYLTDTALTVDESTSVSGRTKSDPESTWQDAWDGIADNVDPNPTGIIWRIDANISAPLIVANKVDSFGKRIRRHPRSIGTNLLSSLNVITQSKDTKVTESMDYSFAMPSTTTINKSVAGVGNDNVVLVVSMSPITPPNAGTFVDEALLTITSSRPATHPMNDEFGEDGYFARQGGLFEASSDGTMVIDISSALTFG